jgi:hypothetical protein
MNRRCINIISAILSAIIFCIGFSCKNNHASDNAKMKIADSVKSIKTKIVSRKPPGTYQDTLTIDVPSAVFYHPDSLQLEKIRQLSDSVFYIGSMHEYFYMMRNARSVIKKEWPKLKIMEAKNYRYLLFRKKDGSKEYIDLDKNSEVYGLFLFDGKKTAQLADMANIDTELYFYFKN